MSDGKPFLARVLAASSRAAGFATALTLLAPLAACKDGSAPTLLDMGDQVAVVGQQLVVQLAASDPDGDSLIFEVAAPSVPDLQSTTAITRSPSGQGIFTFTPLANQIGVHPFDFSVTDGNHRHTLTVTIDVRGAVGAGSMPSFRKPLGAGTVLDLDQGDCMDLDIEVGDPDSAAVTLDQQPPLIEGATLMVGPNGLTGTWSWCPSRSQIENHDRYYLSLSADDGDNPIVIKDFVIVLRRRSGEGCPGKAPFITHTPADITTNLDLQIQAQIEDDQGLGSTPYIVYATEDPGDPIDFAQTTLANMNLVDGDMVDGTWRGMVPNFLANEAEGTSAPLFYLLSASDDDDPDGDCDHRTDDPQSGMHRISVTLGGGDSAGLCEPCSFDVQCGGAADLCLPAAGEGGVCGQGCSGDSECDSGYICSPTAVESVEGASARQCIPNTGSCGGSTGNCEDDDHEPDSTVGEGQLGAAIGSGTSGRVLCPDDDDWYVLEVDADAQVEASLEGDNPPDIDLALTSAAGVLIDSSDSLSSSESITSDCLEPGTYMLRVHSIDSSPEGSYSIDVSLNTDACGGPMGGVGDCCEDNNSPGCEEPAVEACVCGMDSYCCETEWDDLCAGIAADDCDACVVEPPNEDCCTAQESPGCTDPVVETCVCANDAYCCDTQWDTTCVGRVGSDLCAPSCDPDDADGPCCEDNGTAGCEINAVESCVCAEDPFCCDTFWDAMCVEAIATHGCGECPPS